jgi:hypothetical protein
VGPAHRKDTVFNFVAVESAGFNKVSKLSVFTAAESKGLSGNGFALAGALAWIVFYNLSFGFSNSKYRCGSIVWDQNVAARTFGRQGTKLEHLGCTEESRRNC